MPEELLGLAYADPYGLAAELGISPEDVDSLIETLLAQIQPSILVELDRLRREPVNLPFGAELGRPPKGGRTHGYDEE